MSSWASWPHLWIPLTLMAVVMQSVRTAGQKHLTSDLTPVGATLVRFVFGLPFAIMFLVIILRTHDARLPPLHAEFWFWIAVAGALQIVATALLVHLFSLRNFAVGTTYVRAEAFLTAVIGVLFFGEIISAFGWMAIVLSVLGVIFLTIAKSEIGADTVFKKLWTPAAGIGLLSALCFAVCSLAVRRASLSLGLENWLIAAGTTLVFMIILQVIFMVIYCGWRQRDQFAAMMGRWKICVFVGLTSALGSIGWFTAFTLERASYVKSLGQIEFLLALAISGWFFREKSNRLELVGMLFVACGVVMLVLLG